MSEFNPNPSIIYHPINYRNSQNGLLDIAILSNYPTLAYKNDYYNTWLAQNSNIIKLNALQEDNNYSAGLWNSGTNALNSAVNSAMSTIPDNNGQSNYSGAISGIISAPNMRSTNWSSSCKSRNISKNATCTKTKTKLASRYN